MSITEISMDVPEMSTNVPETGTHRMNKQRGVISQLYLFGAVAISAFMLGGWVAWEFQGMRLATCKAAAEAFKTRVEAEGKVAKLESERQVLADRKAKEKADETNKRLHASNRAIIERLRRSNDSARRSVVPPTPVASSRPDLACFDRSELERTYGEVAGRFRAGVRSLVDEGTKATIDLNTAKQWAAELQLKLSTTLK